MVYYENYTNYNNIRVIAIKSAMLKMPNEISEKTCRFLFSKLYSQQSAFLLLSVRQPKLKIQSVTFDKFIRNTYKIP